jgi:repressor LexA
MTIGEKIKQARIAKGLTQEELAEKLGYKSRSSINKIETGGRDIPRSQIQKIADILEVSPISLLGLEDNTPAVESNATMLPDSNVRMIPVYESVSAGFGAHAENMIVDYMPLYIVSAAEAENTLIIRVEGDSMYPKIEDGDSIQVLRQDFADNGQVAVLLIDGEDAVVKQFFHDRKAKTVTLHSFNPDYKDRVFDGIEMTRLRVLGVVKKVIKEI